MSGEKYVISRVTRSKKEAQSGYDKLSRWYDISVGPFEKKFRTAGLEKLAPKNGELILEIGFGTGHCLLSTAQSVGESGKVYGIDLSSGMVERAGRRIQSAGLADRVILKCCDALKVPYKSNFFDAVFMSFTLELFDTPEIPVVLKECNRVLKPGGRVCIAAMSKSSKDTIMIRAYEWAHKKFPKLFDCRPIYAEQALEEAGFASIDAETMSMWMLQLVIAAAVKNI
jgi:ubiquinone/menaquinone biosynthesis C-methylase UbiE